MSPLDSPNPALAKRLRALRRQHWPDLPITQQQLAEALGGDHALSESLISSWESLRKPVAPPPTRLRGIATFFATRRSVEHERARLLDDDELTADERALRDTLHEELLRLRYPDHPPSPAGDRSEVASVRALTSWHFPDQRPVTIVCARLPGWLRERMLYADPEDPDYVRAFTYADLDALIELHGHIRATNPDVQVNIRLADSLEEDDYTAHLVLLGGVDWNPVTRDILRRLALPIRQRWASRTPSSPEERAYDGVFEVGEREPQTTLAPVLDPADGRLTLREDVGHFHRGANPYNAKRTLTLCNGMFGRGTYGVVRVLTDPRFRDRNEEYLAKRFAGRSSFSIVCRVVVAERGEALTPDWTIAENRLYEWPEE
jgi:transcriptional regulator with XRE-family HTH domain